jgi:hypothetical protein
MAENPLECGYVEVPIPVDRPSTSPSDLLNSKFAQKGGPPDGPTEATRQEIQSVGERLQSVKGTK